MRVLAIARRELWEILSNKKFMLAFIVQTLLLLALLPAFGNLFAQGNLALPTPTLKGFTPLGVVVQSDDCSVLLASLEQNERLRLYSFSSPPEEELRRGLIAGYLLIPPEYRESTLEVLEVKLFLSQGIKSSSTLDAVKESVERASAELAAERQRQLNSELGSAITLKREFLKPVVVVKRGENRRFSSFFLAYLVPLVLFFPIFMSGGLVVDAIVGEKERGTIEALLTAPFSRYEIVLGKFLALWGFVTAECGVWIIGVAAVGVPLARPAEALVLLAALNALVVAIAILLALYSRNLKEANIALMLFYVPLFVALIYALTVEFFSPRNFFAYIPFNLISRAVSGETFVGHAFPLVTLLLSALAACTIAAAAVLSYRDDVIFGPRPGFLKIAGDVVEATLERGRLAGAALALVLSPLLFIAATVAEVALAALMGWLLGLTVAFLYTVVLLSAVVEEVLKLLPVLLVLRRRRTWVSAGSILLVAAASAMGFFLVETAITGFVAGLLFSIPLTTLLYARATSTLVMHLAGGMLAGLGVYRRGKRGFLLVALAIALHALFNLIVLEVAL